MKTFVKINRSLAIEICNLHEAGFKLADYQRDLTFIQKLFLNEAYQIYNKHVKDLSENEDNTSPSEKDSWNKKYLQQIEEKKQKGG